jgi:hypothetical protein
MYDLIDNAFLWTGLEENKPAFTYMQAVIQRLKGLEESLYIAAYKLRTKNKIKT